MNTHLSTSIKMDYEQFVIYVNQYKDELNQLDALNANKANLKFKDLSPIGFGLVDNTSITYEGQTYLSNQTYNETTYYQLDVSIFPISNVFDDFIDDTNYLILRYEGFFTFVDANAYFSDVFVANESQNYESYIIYRDGYIFLSSDSKYSTKKFGVYFDNSSERNAFFEAVKKQDSGLFNTSYLNNHSFVGFDKIDVPYFNQLFIVNVHDYDTVVGSHYRLTETLIILSVVLSLIFIGFLLIGYKLVEFKLSDIERSKFRFYYDKPMIVKINKHGKINTFNQSFKEKITNYKSYVSVNDFMLTIDDDNIMDLIKRQKVVPCRFEFEKETLYLRFIVLKSNFGYLLVADNFTSLERKYQSYRSVAYFDQLTKLPNNNHLKQDLKQFHENPDFHDKNNALIAFSMFNFNNYVKLLGDVVVKQMILKIKTTTIDMLKEKKSDFYHLFQDHFAILLYDVGEYTNVTKFVHTLLTTLENTIDIEDNKFVLDFRFGIFNIEDEKFTQLDSEQIYDNVMLSLERAKTLVSNKVVTYDITIGQYINKKEQMEKDLIKAIENKEFVMYLQPQYSTTKDKIIGFEALIRWDHPKYINESPESYISLAESNNLIIDIGRIVMHQTFKMAKDLEKYNINISMNISPVQLLQAGFINEFIETYQSYNLKPNSISIEVTETFLMTSFALIIEKLKLLQKFGISIHLDDFGTGYSSLLYLKELPINAIKIDRKFIMYAMSDKYSKAIINMIVSLAKNLDLEVIAEGIEDEKQYNLLKKSGCDIIQGYYIGKAAKYEDSVILLEEFSIEQKGKKR